LKIQGYNEKTEKIDPCLRISKKRQKKLKKKGCMLSWVEYLRLLEKKWNIT